MVSEEWNNLNINLRSKITANALHARNDIFKQFNFDTEFEELMMQAIHNIMHPSY